MNPRLTTLAVAALAVPGLAFPSQEGRATKDYGQATDRMAKAGYAGVSDILGAEVQLQSAGEDKDTVEIQELIVNVETGEIDWAVLDTGSRMVAVPTQKITCSTKMDGDDEKKAIVLALDRAKLDTLPEFDLSASREAGLDSSLVALETSWKSSGWTPRRKTNSASTTEAGARRTPTALVAGTDFMTMSGIYVPISELDDAKVYARRDEFGSIDNLVLDPSEHRIAFAIISHGGVLGMGDDKYLVPFSAIHTGQPKDDDDETVLCIDMPADAVAVEPARYEEPEKGLVSTTNADSAKKVFSDASSKRGTHGAVPKDVKDKGTEKRSSDSEEGHSDRSGGSQRSGG